MSFFDAFVLAVPADRRDAYLAHAAAAAKIFRAHGALRVVEGWGADVPEGETTSLPMAVKRADGEVVALGWVEWPSRAVRDAAMPKLMEDMQASPDLKDAPYDGRRMIFGGFETILDT